MAQFSDYLFTSSIILRPSIHQTIYDPVISLLSPYPQPRSISSLQPENLIWTCSHRMVSAGLVSKFQREQPSQPLRHMGWNSTLTMSMNWMVMMLYLCLVWYVRPTPMASHSTIAGGYGCDNNNNGCWLWSKRRLRCPPAHVLYIILQRYRHW